MIAVRPPAAAAVPRALRLPDWLDALWPVLVSLAATLLVYGTSLSAGLMFDAPIDLPRATNRSWLELVTSAGNWPYYRPVTLLIWKALYQLLGRNDGLALHALSLATHIVAVWLAYQLVSRLLDRWSGVAAMALFAWFPASYQVVAFVNSVYHSLASDFVLAAAVLYWDWLTLHKRRRLAASLACAGLALFTHESAIAMLAILPAVGWVAVRVRHGALRSAVLSLFPFLGVVALWGMAWLVVPHWPSTFQFRPADIRLNGEFFLQGLAMPAELVLGRFNLLAVAAAVLLALLLVAWRRKRLEAALLALAWFAAASAPAVLLLPWPDYVIDAPRLLYLASPGIALLWAAALTPSTSGRRWSAVAGGLLLAGILGQSFVFLAQREHLVEKGATVVNQLLATATRTGPQAGRIYVNVPAFLGLKQEPLPLGHFGVTMLPDYFGLDLPVAAAAGQQLPIVSYAVPELQQPWRYAYAPQGKQVSQAQLEARLRQGGGVYVTNFQPDSIELRFAGAVDPALPAAQPLASFGGWAQLLEAQTVRSGGLLQVRLEWRALSAAPGDYTVFVHAVAAGSDQPITQDDGYTIAGILPLNHWHAGDIVLDERYLTVPAGARPAAVLVGLYDRANPALRALLNGAPPSAGNAFTIPLSN